VTHVRKSKSGPDENPGHRCFPQSTGSVTRALRTAVFLLQVVVVAGIRKVLDWLIP